MAVWGHDDAGKEGVYKTFLILLVTIGVNPVEDLSQPLADGRDTIGKTVVRALKFVYDWFHVEIKIGVFVCNLQNGRLVCNKLYKFTTLCLVIKVTVKDYVAAPHNRFKGKSDEKGIPTI